MPLTKVSSGVIAANAVVDSFGTQSITGDKLGLTAINANNIVGGAVTGDKLGATSINANNIVNASITASQLATSLNLATNNVQVSSIQSATGTPAITFAANGQMTLANTPLQLTGGQIVFPATQLPSADGNTLDDYEEGTWTPTVTPASGTITSYTSAGTYTKIGKMVLVAYIFQLTDPGSASGSATIPNLPFEVAYNSNLDYTGPVRETAVTGNWFFAIAAGGTSNSIIWTSTNGPISWGTNYRYTASITYRVA